MPTNFDDVEAMCPFYQRGDKRKIVCEGPEDQYSLELVFDARSDRDKHREEYCNTYNYHNCHVCKLIERKYE
ncbi:MAG: hypothetical protein PHP50_09660 [Lachnospiraceae bacterium]|nr:hypothetical protein [Lachnospiraceae bacterium]